MTKKSIGFAYEKKRRNGRITQTVLTIAVACGVVAYLFYSGHLSAAKVLGFFGGG